MKCEIIDHGDYIEFSKPLDGIIMVHKGFISDFDWERANEYAKNLRVGGFDDWQIPLIDELITLKKNLTMIDSNLGLFWSSSVFVNYEATELQEYDIYYRLLLDIESEKRIKKLFRIVESSYNDIIQSSVQNELDTEEEMCLAKVMCIRVSKDKKLNREKDQLLYYYE